MAARRAERMHQTILRDLQMQPGYFSIAACCPNVVLLQRTAMGSLVGCSEKRGN